MTAEHGEMKSAGRPLVPSHAFWAGVAVLIVLYLLGVNGLWRFQRDGALYLSLGRSLAESGTFAANGHVHTYAFPGFPAMLALVFATAGENFWVMNLMVSALGVGAALLGWALCGALPLSRREAVTCAVVFAFSRTLYYYSTHILSDVPFTFLFVLGLLCGARMVRARGRAAWLWCVGASAAVCAATAVRPVGPALLAGLLGAVWLRRDVRRRWRVALGRTAILLGPMALAGAGWIWRCWRAGGGTTYAWALRRGDGLLGPVFYALGHVPQVIMHFSDGVLGTDMGSFAYVPLAALAVAGAVGMLRRGERVCTLTGIAYLVGINVASPSRRYMLPVLVVVYAWLIVGAGMLGAFLTRAPALLSRQTVRRLGWVAVGLLLLVNLARVSKVVWQQRHPDFYRAIEEERVEDYFALSDWLLKNTGPRAVVIAREHRLLNYTTRRNVLSARFILAARASGHAVGLRGRRVYIVRDSDEDDAAMQIVRRRLTARRSALEEVRPFGSIDLIRVNLARRGEDPQ